MAKKAAAQNGRADLPASQDERQRVPTTKKDNSLASGERADKIYAKPSSLLDTRVVYCGDNLEQLANPAFSPRRRSHARRVFGKTSTGVARRSAGNLRTKTNSR
jgi:hypothetical protein